MRYHEDERRRFYGDIFDHWNGDLKGDINVVYLNECGPIAWHRHMQQDDRLFLVSGALRVRMFLDHAPKDRTEHILVAIHGERKVLTIPRFWWHGYEALVPDTIILQFNGPTKWDGADEARHPIDDEFPWT
jgi:dTDP-4-dehydrorhamnose 3,5-epimerase-like enzyme